MVCTAKAYPPRLFCSAAPSLPAPGSRRSLPPAAKRSRVLPQSDSSRTKRQRTSPRPRRSRASWAASACVLRTRVRTRGKYDSDDLSPDLFAGPRAEDPVTYLGRAC